MILRPTSQLRSTVAVPRPPRHHARSRHVPSASSWSPARPAGSARRYRSPARQGRDRRAAWSRRAQAGSALRRIVAAGHPQPTILPLDFATATADDFGNVAARSARSSAGSTGSYTRRRCSARSGRSSISPSIPGRGTARQPRRTDGVDPLVAAAAVSGARRQRRFHARHPRRGSARLLGRLRRSRPACRRSRAILPTNGKTVRTARQCGGAGADAFTASLADASRRGSLGPPAPEALVPLYLHLLGAQAKAESGMGIDAQRGSPVAAPASPLTRVAKQHAQPPKFFLGIVSGRIGRRTPRAPSGRHTIVVTMRPTNVDTALPASAGLRRCRRRSAIVSIARSRGRRPTAGAQRRAGPTAEAGNRSPRSSIAPRQSGNGAAHRMANVTRRIVTPRARGRSRTMRWAAAHARIAPYVAGDLCIGVGRASWQ